MVAPTTETESTILVASDCAESNTTATTATSTLSDDLDKETSTEDCCGKLRRPNTKKFTASMKGRALSGKQQQQEKSVVFDLERNTTRLFQNEYADLKDDEIWFSPDDHKNMKARSRSDAREWRRLGYSILLNETFETPRNDAQDYLNAFAQLPDRWNRRGLERQCSQRHGDERSELKEHARQSLLRTQEQFKKRRKQQTQQLVEQEQGENRILSLDDDFVEKLSLCYISTCRNARIFARRMGKADESEMKRLMKLEKQRGNSMIDDYSELAHRILSQNGVTSPYDSSSQHQHLIRSNYSITSSVNSFDSQRQWSHQIEPSTAAAMMTTSSHNQHHLQQHSYHHHNHQSIGRVQGHHPASYHHHPNHLGGVPTSARCTNNNNRNYSSHGHNGVGTGSVGSLSSSGRRASRRVDGGPPTGMGEEYYAAIA